MGLRLPRKSDTTAAIHYALARWRVGMPSRATAICDDGRIEIDDLPAERALRAIALGRKKELPVCEIRSRRRTCRHAHARGAVSSAG